MKYDFRGLGRFVTLLLIVISCDRVSPLRADTVSWPVSVAIPTGMVGELASRPVSIAIPTGMVGDLASRPVSVAIPSGVAGELGSKPVCVAFPVSVSDNSYIGKPVSVAVQSEVLVDPDLAGLWHMDGDWGDASGNNNHGVPYNGAAFSSTQVAGGAAGSFDGIDDYVLGTTNGFPQGSTARTILVWLNTVNTSGDHAVFHYGASSTNPPSQGFQLLVTGGKAAVEGGEGSISGTSIVSDGKWHLLAVVYEGTSTNIVRLYVDGAEQNSWVITVPATAGQIFTIGRLNAGGAHFNGLIDEVAIYKRALTAEEIRFRYASGVSEPGAPAPPTLNPLSPIVGISFIAVGGTKPVGTSIWINGKKVVANDGLTTWRGTYAPLLPGGNILEVMAMDSSNRLSSAVTASTFYGNTPQLGNLCINISGTGSGTFTGTGYRAGGQIGFSCGIASTAKFDLGSWVDINAAPAEYSLFTNWTGCDFVSGVGCSLAMNSDRTVSAKFDFDISRKARIGDTTRYHSTLQSAYDNSQHSEIIKAWATDFAGDLSCALPKNVTLKGGYCEDYSSNSGFTVLNGKLTIKGGALTVEKLIIK